MMKIWLLSIACVLGATSAHADPPPYQPVHLPPCEVFTMPGGVEVCGYKSVADWRAVLRVDAGLTEARARAAAELARADAEHDRAEALAAALDVRAVTVADLQRSLAAERAALKERDRLYQRELHRPRWGGWLSWSVAAVATGAAVGLYLVRD